MRAKKKKHPIRIQMMKHPKLSIGGVNTLGLGFLSSLDFWICPSFLHQFFLCFLLEICCPGSLKMLHIEDSLSFLSTSLSSCLLVDWVRCPTNMFIRGDITLCMKISLIEVAGNIISCIIPGSAVPHVGLCPSGRTWVILMVEAISLSSLVSHDGPLSPRTVAKSKVITSILVLIFPSHHLIKRQLSSIISCRSESSNISLV